MMTRHAKIRIGLAVSAGGIMLVGWLLMRTARRQDGEPPNLLPDSAGRDVPARPASAAPARGQPVRVPGPSNGAQPALAEEAAFVDAASPRGDDPDGRGADAARNGSEPSAEPVRLRMERLRRSLGTRSPDHFRTILTLLSDENAIIRAESARGLGDYATPSLPPESVSALEQALADAYPAVVIEAARSLARSRSRGSEDPLLNLIAASRRRADGYDMAVRIAAMDALGHCAASDSDAAAQALCAELARHEDLSHDNAAVQALGRLAHPYAIPHLRSHWEWLLRRKPEEPIAIQAWQEAVNLTRAALLKHGVTVEP